MRTQKLQPRPKTQRIVRRASTVVALAACLAVAAPAHAAGRAAGRIGAAELVAQAWEWVVGGWFGWTADSGPSPLASTSENAGGGLDPNGGDTSGGGTTTTTCTTNCPTTGTTTP
jgi:hypothetical protein